MDGNGIRRGSTGHARIVKPGSRSDEGRSEVQRMARAVVYDIMSWKTQRGRIAFSWLWDGRNSRKVKMTLRHIVLRPYRNNKMSD